MKAPVALPNPKKQLPCRACGDSREHVLQGTRTGCSWICSACQSELPAYTHAQMRDLLFQWTRGLSLPSTPDPSTLPSTANVKVFIEGAEAPVELAPQFVEQHVRITGALPKVGEPMYTSLPELPPALCRVPYGKVLLVQHLPEGS